MVGPGSGRGGVVKRGGRKFRAEGGEIFFRKKIRRQIFGSFPLPVLPLLFFDTCYPYYPYFGLKFVAGVRENYV